jgi:hypothetical protein
VWDACEEILFALIFGFFKNKFLVPVNLYFTRRERKEKMKWTFLSGKASPKSAFLLLAYPRSQEDFFPILS